MKRNLKALGLLLAAVFAMSAMATSAAALEHKETAEFWADGPATIDATGEKGSIHEFIADGRSFKCGLGADEIAVHGTAELPVESKTLTTEKESLQYTNCHVVLLGITFPVTVDFNSCDYRFTAGETVAHGSTGTVDIVCEKEGDEITITVFDNPEHNLEKDRCVIHIKAQNNLGTLTYTNIAAKDSTNGKKSVTVDVNVTGIHSTITDTNKLGCNKETTDNTGTYTGTFWAEGTNADEGATDIEVT